MLLTIGATPTLGRRRDADTTRSVRSAIGILGACEGLGAVYGLGILPIPPPVPIDVSSIHGRLGALNGDGPDGNPTERPKEQSHFLVFALSFGDETRPE